MCDSLFCVIFINLCRIHFLPCSSNCLKSGFTLCVFLFYFIIIMWNPASTRPRCISWYQNKARFLPWHKEEHVGEDLLPQMTCMNAMRLHAMHNQRRSFNEQRSGLIRFQSSSPPQPLKTDLKTTIQIHVMWRGSILMSRRRTTISKRRMNTLKEFVQ